MLSHEGSTHAVPSEKQLLLDEGLHCGAVAQPDSRPYEKPTEQW
ncbi:hypothetical protein [Streptomyces sp. NPDC101776]